MDRSLGDDRIEWKAAGAASKSSWPLIIGVVWLAAGLGVLYSYGAPYFSAARPGAVVEAKPAPVSPEPAVPAERKTETAAAPADGSAASQASSGAAAGIAAEAAKDPVATVIINDQAKRDEKAKDDKAGAKQAKTDEPKGRDSRNADVKAGEARPRDTKSTSETASKPDSSPAAGSKRPVPARTAKVEDEPRAAPVARETSPSIETRDRGPSQSSGGGDFRSLRESVLRDALETPPR